MIIEIWKDIEDYPNYQISNFGRVRSKERLVNTVYNSKRCVKERILLQVNDNRNYNVVTLYNNKGKSKPKLVHRLVASAFIPNPNNYKYINHIDGNKQNNYVDNLEWCTQSHNIKEAYRLGLENPNKTNLGKFGTKNKKARKIKQIDINTNEIINVFYGVCEAGRKTGINYRNIDLCLKNKRNYAGGYKWELC